MSTSTPFTSSERASEALVRVPCALSQSHSLAFSSSPGRKPVEAQTVHFRFSRPALLDAHWPPRCPAALPLATVGSECPFSRQRMGAGAMADPTRGYWSISLSEKPAKWDLVCARGVPARDPRELPGGVKFPGKPLICSTTEDKVFGHSLGKLWSSRRAAPFLPPNFLSPEWLHYAPDMFSSSAAVGIEESLKARPDNDVVFRF